MTTLVTQEGTIVKLDRGFPLVQCDDGSLLRCEHATTLVKGNQVRAVIGDYVTVEVPDGHDKGIIASIQPRTTTFVRRDPAERTSSQVLAANFDTVIIAEPIDNLNQQRIERELVLAHQTGAEVAIILTKSDLIDPAQAASLQQEVSDLAGKSVPVLVVSTEDADSIQRVRELIPEGSVAILVGKSGVGKSSLVNLLVGQVVQSTGETREYDGKGRHTTVDRVMIPVPNGGFVVDMPGIRGLGMWDIDTGLKSAFADIEALAEQCKFRDCVHEQEPGCAVQAAVESGQLALSRLQSYQTLSQEINAVRSRLDEARHMRGEKASDRKNPKDPKKSARPSKRNKRR